MGNHFEGTTNWTDLDVSALASQWLIFMYVLFGGTPYIVTMLMLRKQKDEDTSSHDYMTEDQLVGVFFFASWHILDILDSYIIRGPLGGGYPWRCRRRLKCPVSWFFLDRPGTGVSGNSRLEWNSGTGIAPAMPISNFLIFVKTAQIPAD